MPRSVPGNPDNLIGTIIQVPRGLKASCETCSLVLETTGKEKAEARRGERFNGKFICPTGWLAFWLPCPRCEQMVQFTTAMRLSTL